MSISSTLSATRHAKPVSVDDAMAAAVGSIRERFPDAQPYGVDANNIDLNRGEGAPPFPERRRARFQVIVGDGSMLTKVDLAEVGPWMIKLQTTGPLPREFATDLHSEREFNAILVQMVESQPQAEAPE